MRRIAAFAVTVAAAGVHAGEAGAAGGPIDVTLPVSDLNAGPDLESKKLWTHDVKANGKKDLHCPDRELITPCTTELRGWLVEKNDKYIKPAYDCAKTVFEKKQDDYWVMKNMTHLLLDLDTSDHNFDIIDERNNEFYELGLEFGKKLMEHEDCAKEFDEKDELECRCPLLYAKILLLKLKNANRLEEAQQFFDELKRFEWKGKKHFPPGKAFPWKHFRQTPQVWFDNLATQPVWGEERRKDLPIWDVLEDNYEMIKRETMAAFDNSSHVEDAYRFLYKGGDWNQILLFHGRNYTEACEKAFPDTCALLKKTLPKRAVHHYPWTSNQNEQVVILRMTKGTDVEAHCGPANSILNIHLGISGTDGAELYVDGEKHFWQDGKVIPWDGSFDHSVNCLNCKEDRIVMMVRYMHPDITKEHYRGNKRTHFEDIPADFFDDIDGGKRSEL